MSEEKIDIADANVFTFKKDKDYYNLLDGKN